MILIVADVAGRVEQILTLGGSEALAQIYRDDGKRAFMVDQIPAGPIYAGEGDVVIEQPRIEIGDFDLAIGQETNVSVGMKPAAVDVYFEGNPAGSETIAEGEWSIEVDQPGTYAFVFKAAFPYADTVVTKVVAA
jgi:hypothetical protein